MTHTASFRRLLLSALALTVVFFGVQYAFASNHFTSPDPFTQPELDTNWEADRYFPTDGVTSVAAYGRTEVARIGIDSTDTQPGAFQRTEGIKTVGAQNFGTAVEVDLYVDGAWENNATRAGFWVAGDDGAGARDNLFGIVEFVNLEPSTSGDSAQGDHEGWRIWDSAVGWINLLEDFEYDQWVTLGIELDTDAQEYTYYIDGVEVGTATGGENFIRELFLNSYNYGLDVFPTLGNGSYAAHWHVGEVDTEAPNVSITDPSDGETVSGVVGIYGTVEDDNPSHYWLVIQDEDGMTVAGPGTVLEEESLTNELLYSWDTSLVLDGFYTIKLEARDEEGNKDSGSIHWIEVEVVNTILEPTDPMTKNDCKNGGWESFGFSNQGRCIQFVNTGIDSR